MKKNWTALLLVSLLGMTLLAGCMNSKDDNPSSNSGQMGTNSSQTTTQDAISQMQLVQTELKTVYGENYLATMAVEDKNQAAELLGIDVADIDAFIFDMPLMSAHIDKFAAIKAAKGRADAVERAMRDYLAAEQANTMQYPQNIAKVNAGQVIRKDDVVYLVMLGAINENMDATEQEAKIFAEQEVQKAVDVIERVHNG